MTFRKDKIAPLLIIIASFLVNGVIFVSAAPTQSPPNGGVIQINSNATTPNPSLRINTTGEIDLGSWKGTAIGYQYGGTSANDVNDVGAGCVNNQQPCTPGARSNLGAAKSGSNSDITSLTNLSSISSPGTLILNSNFQFTSNGTIQPQLFRNSVSGGLILDTTSAISGTNSIFDVRTAGTQRLVVTGGGNVGIGTASPGAKLEIVGASGTTLKIVDGNQGAGKLLTSDANGVASWATFVGSQWTTTGSNIYYNTGNVGIGLIAPADQLSVYRTTADAASVLSLDSASGNTGYRINARSNGTPVFRVANTGQTVIDAVSIGSTNGALVVNTNAGYSALFSGGNVGIGTTNPQNLLHLAGGSSIARIRLDDSVNHNWQIGTDSPNAFMIADLTASGARRLWIDGNGNVGISVNTPAEKLDVAGNLRLSGGNRILGSDAGLAISMDADNNSTTEWIAFTRNGFIGGAGGDELMRISEGGNVGIGTTAPASKLEVAGTIHSTSGGVKFPDGTTQTTAYAGSTQTVSAGNVSSGAFGSNTGGGNYTFPASVGIGTTSPTNANLQIGSTNTASTNVKLGVYDSSGAGLHNLAEFTTSGGDGGRLMMSSFYDGGTQANRNFQLQVSDGNSTSNYRTLALQPLGGNVGIGTTSPNAKLEISGAANVLRIASPSDGAIYEEFYRNGSRIGYVGSDTAANTRFVVWQQSNQDMLFGTNNVEQMRILANGNVGIGTTTPTAAKLVIGGSPSIAIDAGGGRIQNLATPPINNNDAATKKYIDDLFTGGGVTNAKACSADATCEMNGANLQGGDLVGVGKLTAATVDPLYEIGGKQYATYGPETIGINVEHFGKGKLVKSGDEYVYSIDFAKAKEGSDLWLFWQTIKEGKNLENIMLNLTPEGGRADLWYDIVAGEKKVIVYGDKATAFSYTLVAPRFDTDKWPSATKAVERGTLLIVK